MTDIVIDLEFNTDDAQLSAAQYKAVLDKAQAAIEKMAAQNRAAEMATRNAADQYTLASRAMRSMADMARGLVDQASRVEAAIRGAAGAVDNVRRAAEIARGAIQNLGPALEAANVAAAGLNGGVAGVVRRLGLMRAEGAITEQSLSRVEDRMRSLKAVAAALGVGLGAREISGYAQQFTQLQGQLRLVTQSNAEADASFRLLYASAQQAGQGLDATVELYTRMSRATKQLGLDQGDLLSITETLNKAVAISNVPTATAAASMFQLSQGFAAGALRGEELNSVMEGTPRVAQAIAEGLGVTIGELRKLGEQGRLTGDAVAGALLKAKDIVEGEFARLPMTLDRALTAVQNSVVNAFGRADQAAGTLGVMSSAVNELVKRLEDPAAIAGLVRMFDAMAIAMSAIASVTLTLIDNIDLLIGGFIALKAAQAAIIGLQFYGVMTLVNRGVTAVLPAVQALTAGLGGLAQGAAVAAARISALKVVSATTGLMTGLGAVIQAAALAYVFFADSGARAAEAQEIVSRALAAGGPTIKDQIENYRALSFEMKKIEQLNLEAAIRAQTELINETAKALKGGISWGPYLSDFQHAVDLAERLSRAVAGGDIRAVADLGAQIAEAASGYGKIGATTQEVRDWAASTTKMLTEQIGIWSRLQAKMKVYLHGEDSLTATERAILGIGQAMEAIDPNQKFLGTFKQMRDGLVESIALLNANAEAAARYKAEQAGMSGAYVDTLAALGGVKDSLDRYVKALRDGDRAAAESARQAGVNAAKQAALGEAMVGYAAEYAKIMKQIQGGGIVDNEALRALNAGFSAAYRDALPKYLSLTEAAFGRAAETAQTGLRASAKATDDLRERTASLARSLDALNWSDYEKAIHSYDAEIANLTVSMAKAKPGTDAYRAAQDAIKRAQAAATGAANDAVRVLGVEMADRKLAADLALAQAQGNDALVVSLERERVMREAATQAVKDYVRAGSEAIGVTQEQYVAQQRAAAGAQYDAVKLAEAYRDTQREILEISKDISRDVSETIYDGLTDPDGATKVVDWFKSLFKRIAVQALSANVILPITTAVVSSAPGMFGVGGSTAGGQASTSGSITDLLGLGKMIGGTGSTDFLGIGGFLNSPIIPSQTVGASMATTNGMLSGAGATGSGVMTSAGLGGLTYGGALGAAGAGFGISQMIAGMAPGNKLASAGGGAIGGAITGLLITGGNPIGAIVGGVAGLIGGMMNDKPSNMEGVNTIVDLSSNSAGVDQGQTGKKYSAENWAAARAASDAVRDAAQTAFGKYADLSASGVSFGVGSRDGSRSYILQNGQIQQEFRASSDEAGMKSLIGQSIAAIGRQYAEKLPIEMQKALQKVDFSQDIDEALRMLDFASGYRDTIKALVGGYGLEDQARKAARDTIEQQIDALAQFKKDAAFLELDDAGAAVREFALTLVGLKESKAAVSETEAALSALDESFKVFRENLGTLGLTLAEVNDGYTASLNKLRDDFNAALDRSINEGMGLGILNQASDLLAAQSQRIKDAAALGADMGRVFRLNALEMASLYKDLGETQIAALNGMIALADDLSLSVSAALARITTGADALITSALDARAEAVRLGQDWAKLAASLRADIAGLRIGSASTLSPQALLAETESQFRALFGQALAGNADAAGNLSGAASTYLEAAKGYYASSEAYQNIFTGVTSMLEQVAVGADTRATGYAALAATMEQQISILEQIRDVIARSQDISVLADTLQGYVTEGAITEATKGGIDAAIASLRPMVAGNEAAIQTLTNIASAVQDGTLTASEVNGLRGAITAMGSIDISAQISTFEAALRETGATIAGLNIFLDDAAGAIPVAIITAFQDGLSAADLAARMGGLMSTTVDAAKTAILGGLTGSALDAAIIAPITDLMRNWASAYTSRLDAVFSGADFAVGFDRSTGRVIAAYQAAAESAAAGITSAVAAVSFDPLTRSVAAAQQLVGGRFAAVIGGITFSGVDGTLITQAVYGENGVITKVAAALEGSATSIAGALSSTIAAADFGLVGARITGAVDILAGGASTVVVAAADLSDSALRLVAAGGAQIDLVAAKLSAGAAEIKALDASAINLIVGAWNSQSIDIAAIDASAVNIAIGEIQSSIDGITVLASGGSAVTGTLGAISGVIINLVAASGSVIALAASEIAGAIIAIGATDRSSVTLAAAGYNDAIAAMFVSGSSKIALAGAGLRDASIAISGLATKAVTDRGIWLKDRVWSIGQAAEGTTRAYGLAVKAGAAEIAAMSADAVVSAAAWLGGRTAAIGGHAADRTMAYGAALRDGAVLIAGLSADSVVSAGDWLKDRTWSAGNHAATKVRAFGEAAKVAAIDIAGLSSSEVTDIGTWTAGRVKAVSDHAVEKTAAYGAALRNSAINIANLATGDLESMSSWLKDRVWSIGEHSAAKIFASGGIIRSGAVAIAELSTENLSVAAAGLADKVSASIESARALLTASTGSITAAGPEIATALASDYAVALKSVIGPSLGAALNAAVAPIFSTSGAKTFSDRLATAFDEVFGASASSGVSASVTALIASNSSMVGALSTLRDQVIALTAQMAADRQSSAVAAAQTAYNAQVSAVGASATAQAQASLAPTIAGAGSSAYQRSYEASFDASGSMISAISHSTNEIARSQERVNGVAAKLTALGKQVTGIIGGDLPSIRINVRDNPASLSPDDLWYIRLQMDGAGTQRVIKSYNGADYTPIIEGYLSNLWRTMTGLSDEYKATLKDINWSPAASGMGDLAMAIERISRPFDGPQFATGGAFYGNGIYDRPTAFNMGVMGENGPEAVMPLANVGGRLGVRVAGGANDNGDAKAVVAELREQNRILRQLLAETAKGDEKTRDALVQRLDTANEISAKSASDAKRARAK